MARVFLILAGLIWFAYGIYMLLAPETLALTAGLSATNTTSRRPAASARPTLRSLAGLAASIAIGINSATAATLTRSWTTIRTGPRMGFSWWIQGGSAV